MTSVSKCCILWPSLRRTSAGSRVSSAAALEPEWEARFEPKSYGFRPGRGCHDAIEAIFNVAKGANPKRRWALDADLAASFDRIDHQHLLSQLGTFPARGQIAGWLKAGVVEKGRFAPTEEGTPQGGVVTPPTQLAIRVYFALRVVLRVFLGPVAGVAADGDGVANGDLVGADEDVFDEQPQDPLALGHASGGSLVAQPGQEVLEVVGELEVDLTVGELGVQGVELVAQAGLAGPQLGHAGAQLVQGDQLLLVGADEPLDRLAGLGQGGVEPFALRGGRVGGAVLGEPLGDLGSDQGGVGQQRGDVVPDEAVEVVGADRLVGADSAVLVAVVVRAQAAVVVDLLVRGPGGGAVVGLPAAAAGADALQQRGIGAVTRREALVVLQPSLDPGPGVFGDQGRDGDLQPLLAVAVDDGVVPWRGAPGQACGAVESGGLLGAHRLGEAGPPGVGGVTQHAPERGAVPAGLAGAGGHAQAAEPAGQLGDRDPAVGVAGEQVRDDRRLVRHGLVAGFGVLALADVAVAERGAGQHVDGAGLGAVGLAAAGAFQDLGAFILGDHALELHQQRVLGAVTAWPFDEHHLGAGLGELLDQQRLVGILAGQPVRGVHQQHVHWHLADQVAQPLQRRADQTRPGMAVVFKHPLLRHVQTQAPGVRAQRRGLGPDRLLLLLPGRGDPGIDRCVAHRYDSLPGRRAHCARAVRGQGCSRPPTAPRPAGDRRRTRSRPPARSPARMLSASPGQELLQCLRDHRGQGAPRRARMGTNTPDERHRQLDGEHPGRSWHRHMPRPAGALQVAVRLPRRAAEPLGQLPRGLRRPHALIEQVGGCVDPLGEHVTTSATTSSRPGVRHVVKILPIMSCLLADTPRPLEPSVTQRDVEAEVANCVGGVVSPVLANLALSVLDEHFAEAWQANSGSTYQRTKRRRAGLANYRIVRYADDFVVLVAGTQAHAGALREDVAAVLAPMGWGEYRRHILP